MRAAASAARICSIGHSGEFWPSGSAFNASQRAGSAHISAGHVGRALRPGIGRRLLVVEQTERRDQREAACTAAGPDRRDLGGERAADRAAGEIGAVEPRLVQQEMRREHPVEMIVEHGVAALAAGEAGQ